MLLNEEYKFKNNGQMKKVCKFFGNIVEEILKVNVKP